MHASFLFKKSLWRTWLIKERMFWEYKFLSLEITIWIPKCLATKKETKERWPKTFDVIEKNELHVLKLLAKYWPSNWVCNNLSIQTNIFQQRISLLGVQNQNLWNGSYFWFIFPTILALLCNRILHLSPMNDTPKKVCFLVLVPF